MKISKSGILSPMSTVSDRSIKIAILQTVGPVSTCKAIRCNWKGLRPATSVQFQAAALDLQQAGFGTVVDLTSQYVFVKKNPADVQGALQAYPDLCPPEVYAERYHRQASRTIIWKVRSKLVAMGLVSDKQFM